MYWPAGEIPYVSYLNNEKMTRRLKTAIRSIESASMIRLVPREDHHKQYLTIHEVNEDLHCSATVGRDTTDINLMSLGLYCDIGSMIHEFLHVFGLWHEHSRPDRDSYINIPEDKSTNLQYRIEDGDMLGEYDYGSM